MEFAYRVRDRHGKVLKGKLEAEDKNSVVESLINQEYYILALEPIVRSSKELDFSLGVTRVKTEDLIVMTRQLSTMMAAGLPIIRCFNILGEQASNKRLKKVIYEIRDDIEGGMALWQAIAKHPDIFTPVYISMIKAGELGGILEPVLDRLSVHLEREQEINSKVKSASIYPTIIAIVALVMVFCIITFVMPSFVSMFESSGVQLPAPTRILLGLSGFFQAYVVHLIVGTIALVYLLKRWGKSAGGRLFFDNLYLHLPIIGKTLSRITVARFARTMGTLLRSGIPVLTALEVVEEVVGNAVIGKAIRKARESISEGDSITIPLEATGAFEPMVTQMIAVGEETGSLDDMLVRMSDYFEKEVIYMVDSMMAVIEPVLILFVAIVVGGIVIATLLPMFEMWSIIE